MGFSIASLGQFTLKQLESGNEKPLSSSIIGIGISEFGKSATLKDHSESIKQIMDCETSLYEQA